MFWNLFGRRQTRKLVRDTGFRPSVEALEDRTLPSSLQGIVPGVAEAKHKMAHKAHHGHAHHAPAHHGHAHHGRAHHAQAVPQTIFTVAADAIRKLVDTRSLVYKDANAIKQKELTTFMKALETGNDIVAAADAKVAKATADIRKDTVKKASSSQLAVDSVNLDTVRKQADATVAAVNASVALANQIITTDFANLDKQVNAAAAQLVVLENQVITTLGAQEQAMGITPVV